MWRKVVTAIYHLPMLPSPLASRGCHGMNCQGTMSLACPEYTMTQRHHIKGRLENSPIRLEKTHDTTRIMPLT